MSAIQIPETGHAVEIISGPQRVGSELRWRGRLDDGRRVLIGMLVPELSSDDSVRRRYVRDVERIASLAVEGLCPVLALGPRPDPRDPSAPPPWRMRLEPQIDGSGDDQDDGERGLETLDAWLRRRAPAPVDEVVDRVIAVAEVIHQIHAQGAVLRDLNPRWIEVDVSGRRAWLTDVGLARVDILSTRTAASLILEGSPYASPEQLRRTVLDQRSDLWGLGILIFHALSGDVPFGDGPALLREGTQAPRLRSLRPDVPEAIDELVHRCLADDVEARPESVAEVIAVLRGEAASARTLVTRACQNCGAAMREGQRLCLDCGRLVVRFHRAPPFSDEPWAVDLLKASEDGGFSQRLAEHLGPLSEAVLPSFNFIIGDQRMYSKDERRRSIGLPVRLFTGMTRESAEALTVRLSDGGFKVKATSQAMEPTAASRRRRLTIAAGSAILLALLAVITASAGSGAFIAVLALSLVLFAVVVIGSGLRRARLRKAVSRQPLLELRHEPAALPASDPLVARLAALLRSDTAPDIRRQVGEMALLVQRLVDHRARNLGEAAEIDLVTGPVEELVTLIEAQARMLVRTDGELSALDEGELVRALAAHAARGGTAEARVQILAGLDRLRDLEDGRARIFHRLLEASRLLRRSVDLALDVHDPEAQHEIEVQRALHALHASDDE